MCGGDSSLISSTARVCERGVKLPFPYLPDSSFGNDDVDVIENILSVVARDSVFIVLMIDLLVERLSVAADFAERDEVVALIIEADFAGLRDWCVLRG